VTPTSETPQVPVVDLSYAEASRELDEIVAFFEQGDLDVDQLVGRLERATEIVDELDRRLRHTRTQVEDLVPRLEAAVAHPARDEPTDDAPPHDDDEAPGLF
jgi:exodeoxyribonuclease VII small subunit